ncbi:MAG: hypothetical protein QJR09_12055 [Micrococcus sp.]|nr:hypothetical protein [Micrococcus sp.]
MIRHQLKQLEYLEQVPAEKDELERTTVAVAQSDYSQHGVVTPVSGDLLTRQANGVKVVTGDDLR